MRNVYLDGKVLVGEATQGLSLIYNCSDMPKQVAAQGTTIGGKERAWVDADNPYVQKGLNLKYFRVIIDGKVNTTESAPQKPKRGRPRK